MNTATSHAPRFDVDRPSPSVSDGKPPLALRIPRWAWDVVAYAPAMAYGPALALGVAGLTGRGPRWVRRRPLLAGLLGAGAVAGLVRWQLERFFAESPDYEVEQRLGAIEVRRYRPRIVAETFVEGADEDAARSEGFRRLAGYIFGSNDATSSIAMTTPVNTRRTIPMTTPVTLGAAPGGHTVTFTMPKDRDFASLPIPRDPRVVVRRAPAMRVAALRFRGTYDSARIDARRAELVAKLRAAGIVPEAEPYFAGYDAPSTLPFLRRAEVWAPLADGDGGPP